MSTVFTKTLRPIIILDKILGLTHISYNWGSDGLLIKNIESSYLSFLEMLRMIVLIISTYIVRATNSLSYINEYRIVKFWAIIIVGRLSEKWTIK